ncbi:MAG TPA: HAD family phosphatase [Armatimonadetes bacterium]|nr:HAD family phosphatase [Armatimonadota bacterium]
MLRAIIFDFDGVIADTEPLHQAMFQKVLAEEGIALTEEEYREKYLALDDRLCFTRVLCDHGHPRAGEGKFVRELMARKAAYFEEHIQEHCPLFPGVPEFVRAAAARYPLAIGSGALRAEIEYILRAGGLRPYFSLIVSAEEVRHSKPHPECYQTVIRRLNETLQPRPTIRPEECLIVEDSFQGLEAARTLGARVLAVTNSYPAERLGEADLVVETLVGLSLEQVEALF